jgi:hypothetical protein
LTNNDDETMAIILLRAKWRYGAEYLQFDTLSPLRKDEQVSTTEWWPNDRKRVSYTTTCSAWSFEGNQLRVSLLYDPKLNTHLAAEDVRWGETHIFIDAGSITATAHWVDKDDPKKWNGEATCKVFIEEDAAFFSGMSYETYRRIARPGQAKLREEMLERYGACALTGSTNHEALDIAHIAESKDGGEALWTNCFLLRADMHRLFDAGLLSFDTEGRALFHESIADQDYDHFRNKTLSPVVFKEIRGALAQWSR